MTFEPLSDRVLVQRDEAPAATPGGIIIPDNGKEKPLRGTVQAVGPGRLLPSGERVPVAVVVGDVVIFGKYAGTEVDGVGLLLNEADILGRYRK